MRSLLVGVLTLAASIALPATLGGPAFLVALWTVIALAGLALILTSTPVKARIMRWLRRELGLEASPGGVSRRHARHVLAELDTGDRTAATAEENGYWWNVRFEGVPADEWPRAREVLDGELYDAVVPAYVAGDRLNKMANNYNQGGVDDLDDQARQRIREFRDAVADAQQALREHIS